MAGIIIDGSRILLGKRRPGGEVGGLWEFPGGKREPGESGTDCLVREFREELNLEASVGELLAKGEFSHKGNRYLLEAYRVYLQKRPETHAVLREHDSVAWFSPGELTNLPMVPSDTTLLPGLFRYLDMLTAGAETRSIPSDGRSSSGNIYRMTRDSGNSVRE